MSKSYFLVRSLVLFALGFFLLSACTAKLDRAGIDPAPQVQANANIANSFQVVRIDSPQQSGIQIDHGHVVILKSALEKEFLLSVNMLGQMPTPMFQALQSRVVSFIQRDQKVYMLDSVQGHSVGTNNIPQTLLLAEFPILLNTPDSLEIDFNQGMKEIFTAGDMFSSDDPGDANAQSLVGKVSFSYLDQVILEDNQLFVRQIAQLDSRDSDDNSVRTVEARYYLAPYLPDTDFVPVKSPLAFDKVGYFEATPLLLADGSKRTYAMKWNEKKPIVFAISANTPADFRPLMKSAVLYWNKILGEGRVQVIQLEDLSITAPNPKYNIIQWADWDSAGYAYADAHLDPRSGQITHAQVFFPSAFIKDFVERRVRQYEGAQPLNPQIGLKGFRSSRLCARDLVKDIVSLDVPPNITAAAMDKAMRDYVYEVVAHEVGHLMGLRHNFAGNLAANYDASQRKDLVLSYYQNMKAPAGIVDSSSVMEYSRFEESSWNGDLFQAGAPALSYDSMAVKHLYLGEKIPDSRPAFCTDSQIGQFVDCNMSDAGQSVFSFSHDWYQFNLQSLAVKTLNTYITKTKMPDLSGDEPIAVQDVVLDAKAQAKTVALDFYKTLSLFKTGAKFIKVRTALAATNLVFEDSVVEKERQYMTAEIERLGGMKQLLAQLPDDLDLQLQTQFNKLVDDPQFITGAAVGQHFEFSDSEKKMMKDNFALFSTQFKKQLILQDLKAFSGSQMSFEATYGQAVQAESPSWIAHQATKDLAAMALERFNHYALAKSDKTLSVALALENGFQKTVELPIYLFDQDVRMATTSLFSNGHESLDWAYFEKKKAAGLIKEQISLLGNLDDINLSALPNESLLWLLGNQQIQDSLK